MKTHHGWRVSVHDVVPSAMAHRRWAIPAQKVHDDFTVLAAALDCCRAMDKEGRRGIQLHAIERSGGREELRQMNWRELTKASA